MVSANHASKEPTWEFGNWPQNLILKIFADQELSLELGCVTCKWLSTYCWMVLYVKIRFRNELDPWGVLQWVFPDGNPSSINPFCRSSIITSYLLTDREGCTGEYWPEVVTVRTEVHTKTTEGQYSSVRPELARLVSSLLYGTLLLIVKCTSGGLHLKNVCLLHPSLKFRKNFNLFSFCW